MSDSSASAVAIASMSLGNAQIVLFGMFVIFVLTFIWMYNLPSRFTFPMPFLSTIPRPFSPITRVPIPSHFKEEVIPVPKSKDEVIPVPKSKNEMIPVPKYGLCQTIVDDNGNSDTKNDLPTADEIKRFKKLLDWYGVPKSLEVLDGVDKRVYALITRVEVLEAAETERKNQETKALADKAYQELVATKIKSVDTKIINGDGVAFDLVLETKPMKEVIEHLRKRFPNMVMTGGLNDNGEVVCWTFKIPAVAK